MTAQLIDGTALSRDLRAQVARDAAELSARGMTPGLAVILVGDDPASQVYTRNKVKACQDHGVLSVFEKYDADLSETDLLARIRALNADPAIHGILVQMPLPRHIDPHKVIETISTAKDVDGYSVQSAGDLMAGLPGFRPCTPYGCMKLIERTGQPVKGRHAVVIGRSNTVGKPMALLLLQANATVTICHSATPDLGVHTRQADIVVAAVGRQAVRRRRLRGRVESRGLDHPGAGWGRSDDDHNAAGQHDRSRAPRACEGRCLTASHLRR
jgi:methylenetetrahydrofolate dehydrogenase (NADP+)/methenyltetrahydrofolate cyclohydrolase